MAVRSIVLGLVLLAAAAAHAQVDTAAIQAAVRDVLEAELQKNVEYGYVSFECDINEDIAPGNRFECSAVTEIEERLDYLIGIDEEGEASVVLASQPASQLSAGDRALLEPPCDAFLEDYDDGSWDALYAPFHPALKDAVTADATRTMLEPVRADLGDLRGAKLETHAMHESGRHEMVYALDCERSAGQARFGIILDDEGARLVAFVVTAAPGSPGQAAMLGRAGRDMLTGLIGEPVVRIEAPLDQLHDVGDAIEGIARLGDGRGLEMRAEQHGRKDDFDPIDYRFQILDAPWLLRRMLEARSVAVQSVDCPQQKAADGAVMTCSAKTGDGTVILTVQRHGGNYSVMESAPAGG